MPPLALNAYRFTFESAGALEITNEYSGREEDLSQGQKSAINGACFVPIAGINSAQ
jgi:hypothetical protein